MTHRCTSLLIGSLIVSLVSGCASSDTRMGSEPDESGANPNPAVYGPSTFTVQKLQHRRTPENNSVFFFRHCSAIDGKTFWSKTSYDCATF